MADSAEFLSEKTIRYYPDQLGLYATININKITSPLTWINFGRRVLILFRR